MKRIMALVLTLAILLSSGLLDATAWAVELASEQKENCAAAEKPSGDDVVSIPVVDFSDSVMERPKYQSNGETLVDPVTQLIYCAIDDDTCEIIGYYDVKAELVVPETLGGMVVRSIADEAFREKKNLVSVSLPDSVAYIGYRAFAGCKMLSKINYPADLEEVGRNLYGDSDIFSDCENLMSIEIPEGVQFLPDAVFSGCNKLQEIKLPSTLGQIGEYAFNECTGLEKIVIPEGVETIPEGAFRKCGFLDSVTLPESLHQIGRQAFASCVSLQQIQLPDSVTYIDYQAFADCKKLSRINYPAGLEEVGRNLYGESDIFRGCENLTSIEIPEGVEFLPDAVFSGCNTLEQIKLPSTLEQIGEYAFNECTALEQIVVPEGVETIPEGVFCKCTNLGSVTLPESLHQIGRQAFASCVSLQQIQLPDSVTYIDYQAFFDCAELSRINYPAGLEEVGRNLYGESDIFRDCENLTSIEIPEGVEFLPDAVFSGCNILEQIKLPSTLEQIGEYAFNECTALEQIVVPEGVEIISEGAFRKCTNLGSVTLPEGLHQIGEQAFASCVSLQQIQLPDSVAYIGYRGFFDCAELSRINYPAGLEEVGRNLYGESDIFRDCENLTSIEIPEGVEFLPDAVFSGCNILEQIKLPSTLEQIGEYAFNECTALEQIVIPEGVEIISEGAFRKCTNLGSVTLPEGLHQIGEQAFASCVSLQQIQLPDSVAYIGYRGFFDCAELFRINYPAGLEEVGRNLYGESDIFRDCENLTSIEVPEGVQFLPDAVFSGCNILEQIKLPATLKTIGEYAFKDCVRLEGIVLPDGVTSIGDRAFYNCEKLSAVWLPSGLTSIGAYAFAHCNSLTAVTIPATVTEIGKNAFADIENLVIHCDLRSDAAIYAINYGIPMVAVNGEDVSALFELDVANSTYAINYDGISATGNLAMVVRYAFRDSSNAEPGRLMITIPESVELAESTMSLDGKLLTDYEFDEEDRILYVPVAEKNGDLRFSLKPVFYDRITTYAKLEFLTGEGGWKTEVVGTVYTELAILNISAPSETAENTVTVTGITIPENPVDLYINDRKVTTVTANKIGSYRADLELTDLSNGKRYTIRAETKGESGNLITAETVVTYREGTPVMTQFIMEHAGQEYRMENIIGMKPVVTFNPNSDFRFTVQFDKVSSVHRVFVVSTRNNVSKSMEAIWDEGQQAYIAKGWFDPGNRDYVPGNITVEYVRSTDKICFTSGFDFTSEEIVNQIPEEWKDADVVVNENTDNKTDVTVEKSDGSASIHIVTEKQNIPYYITLENAGSYGYTAVQDDYGNTVHMRTEESAWGYVVEVLDWTNNVLLAQTIETLTQEVPGVKELVAIRTFAGIIVDSAGNGLELAQMRENIINSQMTPAEKQEALDALDRTIANNAYLTIMRLAVGVAGVAITVYNPILGFLFGVVTKSLDRDLKSLMDKNMGTLGMSLFELFSFKWAIDPSGYVYDEVTKARLPGVTVTAYWIPYDDAVDNFWDAVPSDDEYGQRWDASEYSQLNSLITDAEGRYAWDVPEGWWRVEYVLEGYETTWSEWLPVPPPQTEVNIGLTPLNVPTVRYGDANGDGRVNGLDLILLRQHLAGWDVEPDRASADCNGDSRVNGLDLILLRQYLAGWDVTLGPKAA